MTVPGPFTMSQQAQNDFYESDAELALAYAGAVHDEIAELLRRAPTSSRSTSRTCRPGRRRRASSGSRRWPARSTASGHDRRPHLLRLRRHHPRAAGGYSFLPELATCTCDHISIETAQSNLDTAILETLPGKGIILGVIDLDSHEVETPETVAARIRKALPYKRPDELTAAPDCGMKYLPRDVAFAKLEAMVAGAETVRSEREVDDL